MSEVKRYPVWEAYCVLDDLVEVVLASDYDKIDADRRKCWDEFKVLGRMLDKARDDLDSAEAELAELKAKMEGWQLVPVEPTAEMVAAAFVGKVEAQCVQHQERSRVAMAANYKAMLAAAPSKEQQ